MSPQTLFFPRQRLSRLRTHTYIDTHPVWLEDGDWKTEGAQCFFCSQSFSNDGFPDVVRTTSQPPKSIHTALAKTINQAHSTRQILSNAILLGKWHAMVFKEWIAHRLIYKLNLVTTVQPYPLRWMVFDLYIVWGPVRSQDDLGSRYPPQNYPLGPKNGPSQREMSSSNHQFSVAMFVSGTTKVYSSFKTSNSDL